MSEYTKPCRCFPKTFKSPTVDRIIALQNGMKKRPYKRKGKIVSANQTASISHSSSKKHSKQRPQFATPHDAAIHCAKKYRRTLSHLM